MSTVTADEIRAAIDTRAERREAQGKPAQITDDLHAARVAGAFLDAARDGMLRDAA